MINTKKKSIISLLLLTAILLSGCMSHIQFPPENPAETASPVPTETVTADTAEPAEEATPAPQTQNVPSYTPEPTPVPTATPTPAPTVEPGVYPDQVGIYIPTRGDRTLVTTFKADLKPEEEIDCFEFFPTQKETLSGSRYSTVFNSLWNEFKGRDEMKIGYMLYFKLQNGLEYAHTILKPDDTMVFKNYIETYLYDDVHQTPGVRYSHLRASEVKDNTLCTSIKLVCGEWCGEIEQIKLTAFVYIDNNEFDPTSRAYIGKRFYEITIEPK